MNLSFRQFLELVEVKPNYIDKLGDELGISPQDLEKSPQWLPNAKLGNYFYNGMTYRIKEFLRSSDNEITGAVLVPMDTQRAYQQDKEGRMVRDPNPSKAEITVSKDQLNQMMNPAPPQPTGGQPGMGGMPSVGGLI
jgi:hypothetical protein